MNRLTLEAPKVCELCGGQYDQREITVCLVNGLKTMAHWGCAKNENAAAREADEGVADEPWP